MTLPEGRGGREGSFFFVVGKVVGTRLDYQSASASSHGPGSEESRAKAGADGQGEAGD